MRIRYLTAACALTIVILGLLTLAFSTYAKRALYVKQSPSSVNVALLSNGAGLEGRIFNGMASTLFNRRAIWDHAGKFAGGSQSAQPTISVSDVSVTEGNSGSVSAVFNIKLSTASSKPITISYTTANGTATTPSDYTAASGTITFGPGATTTGISVPVIGDTTVEPNENFFLNLSNPINATINDGQGIGTILNADTTPTPAISISDVSVTEGNSGSVSAVFNVTLSNASTQTISVNYATADGSATSSSDYFAGSGTVTFIPGQTSQPISIQAVGDTAVEPNENFFVNLSSPVNATLADGQGVGTMLNDDVPPPASISISDATVNEGNSGTTPVVFNVTLSSASAQAISVNYVTANGTASSTSDYVGTSGTVTFAPGQTSQPISIQVVGDTAVESNENFFVNLSGPVNATVADGQGVGTIVNDDVSISYFEIPVYFHVIQDTNGDGYVNESRLDAQINVLNSAFNGASVGANVRFFFWKAGVTQHYNHDWFNMDPNLAAENDAKRVLRQGGANALNFYTTRGGRPPEGSPYPYGWAWFPSDYASNPCRDGVVVPFTTLPEVDSNPGNPYNAGDLPVHEVGHWLGLYHTYHDPFERNDCAYVNDEVADTPVHLNSSIGQCIQEDTCSSPGVDPIHNFMTNTSDACKYEFTRGQFERMADQYMTYRQSSTPPQCPLPAYEGWVDFATCNWISGWAADRDRPNAPINVSIYDGDTRVITILASDSRSDVGAYLGDNGQHGFTIETPQVFKDGLPHTLRVKFEGSTFQLNGSPKTIACATYYEVVARHSGKCLDVERESMASGARVIQFVCGGWANQQWQVIPVGGGYYKIVARHSGKVLDVQGAALDNGTPVWQWDENGTAAQQWEIIDVGGGYVRIIARHSGKALDVAGGSTADLTQIHQWDYVGIANQQWLLRPVP